MSDVEAIPRKDVFFATELAHAYELFVASHAVKREADRQHMYYHPDKTAEQLEQRRAVLTIGARVLESSLDAAVDRLCERWPEVRDA